MALADRSLICTARMFTRASGLRQASDCMVLDLSCENNMRFINPQTVAVSLIAIHLAVGGRTTKSVPSRTDNRVLWDIDKVAGATLRCLAEWRYWLRRVLRLRRDGIKTGYCQEHERSEHEASKPFHSFTSYATQTAKLQYG
jgi:hypothetical protein